MHSLILCEEDGRFQNVIQIGLEFEHNGFAEGYIFREGSYELKRDAQVI